MGDDGDGVTVPIPQVGVPTKDQVLDTTDNALQAIIAGGGAALIGIILVMYLAKKIFEKVNFKVVAVVAIVLFVLAYFGMIGKG